MRLNGVRLLDLARLAQPNETATHILCYGYDDYNPNVSMDEALKPDVLLVHTVEGKPLPKEHGVPVRMITPQLYASKARNGLTGLNFSKQTNGVSEKKEAIPIQPIRAETTGIVNPGVVSVSVNA